MLLSKENLHALSSEVEQEQTKLDRILLYVCEQKTRCAQYNSPNHSPNGTQSSSSSAILSSASFKQTTVEDPNKSIASEKHNKLLPQTQANAFHLLQKFTSPNLEMNRLTLKPKTRPKLGLFNKGKSSAQATKTVPDLVFSETKFLKRKKEESLSNDHSTAPKKNRRQHSISKFFKSTSDNRSQHTSVLKTKSFTSPVKTKSHTPAIKSLTSPVKTKTYESPVNTRSYVSLAKSKTLHANNKQVLSIKSSVSSNESIERILKECQAAPDVFDCRSRSSFDDHYYSYYTHDSDTEEQSHHQQLPTYSHVRTPTSHILAETIVIDSSQEGCSSDFDFSREEECDMPSSEPKDKLLLFYKEHNIMQQELPSTPHDGSVDWQIESIASLEDTKCEYDDDILKFWEYQIKRTL